MSGTASTLRDFALKYGQCLAIRRRAHVDQARASRPIGPRERNFLGAMTLVRLFAALGAMLICPVAITDLAVWSTLLRGKIFTIVGKGGSRRR